MQFTAKATLSANQLKSACFLTGLKSSAIHVFSLILKEKT